MKIDVIFPDSDYTPDELYLEPGSRWETKGLYETKAPVGTHVVKLIISQNPMDLRNIESTRGQEVNKDDHPFAKLFAATYFYENRGSGGRLSLSPVVDVKTIVYEILE